MLKIKLKKYMHTYMHIYINTHIHTCTTYGKMAAEEKQRVNDALETLLSITEKKRKPEEGPEE